PGDASGDPHAVRGLRPIGGDAGCGPARRRTSTLAGPVEPLRHDGQWAAVPRLLQPRGVWLRDAEPGTVDEMTTRSLMLLVAEVAAVLAGGTLLDFAAGSDIVGLWIGLATLWAIALTAYVIRLAERAFLGSVRKTLAMGAAWVAVCLVLSL